MASYYRVMASHKEIFYIMSVITVDESNSAFFEVGGAKSINRYSC